MNTFFKVSDVKAISGRTPPLIGIVDIGLGNIRSISRMIEKLGGQCTSVSSPSDLESLTKLILPGVGHFDYGIRRLRDSNLSASIIDFAINRGGTILGICLGMQLLCQYSQEGSELGLSLIDAHVELLGGDDPNLKIPHMGWNLIHSIRENPLLPFSDDCQRFYFVHSYKVVTRNPHLVICTANYGGEFCAAFQSNNLLGVQFHPEKSHSYGMKLIKRFLEM